MSSRRNPVRTCHVYFTPRLYQILVSKNEILAPTDPKYHDEFFLRYRVETDFFIAAVAVVIMMYPILLLYVDAYIPLLLLIPAYILHRKDRRRKLAALEHALPRNLVVDVVKKAYEACGTCLEGSLVHEIQGNGVVFRVNCGSKFICKEIDRDGVKTLVFMSLPPMTGLVVLDLLAPFYKPLLLLGWLLLLLYLRDKITLCRRYSIRPAICKNTASTTTTA